jgi:hypothetical protein
MKKIILILLFVIYANANNTYKITYKNMTLGDIKNMNTIKDGYLIALPSSSWMRYILGFDKFVLFQEHKKPKANGKVRYKKDKYMLLSVIYNLSKNIKSQTLEKDNRVLKIKCNGKKCTYTRTKNGKQKIYKGHIYFDKNNKLVEICDNDSGICIKK